MEEKRNLGPDLVREIEDKAKIFFEWLKVASNRQESYVNLRCRDIEYQAADKVFLKVSPWKKVCGSSGKVSSIRGSLALARSDPSHVVHVKEIKVQLDLLYEEEPVSILDCEVKVLRNKMVPLVKVLWRNHKTEETIWESEDITRCQYSYLFDLGKFLG
ncbi:uncharacterized protein [Gossypium hirsutum]|uniref:Chromo domain-containing protein n=1 Tax=Gossypium hirsutum TaxID=3635 RepID=A0A1U8KIH3_GOSHI|nr:uncharacterized protein LOC107917404 [Gossypium hirsutum]